MSAGILGFIAGLGKGFFQGTLARRKDDRAERGLNIHESVEGRKAFWDQQQKDWREYMETRPTPDGKSQWDMFWEDPNAIPDGPMSPIGAPPHPGPEPQGAAGEQGPALEEDPAAPQASASPGDPGSQSGGPTQLQGSGSASEAIPVPAQVTPSAVATPAWNKIGFAAEGGPVSVGPATGMTRSGQGGQLWQDPNQQEALPMSPIGQEDPEEAGWRDKLAAHLQDPNRVSTTDYADQQPGLAPIERSPSQMNLRGSGVPIQGVIDAPPQPFGDPRMVAPQAQMWGRAAEGGPVVVLPKFAEGGAVEVPAEPVAPQALPAQGPAPQQSAAPQREPSKYRDRLSAWQRQAENHAMMAGGLETLTKFRDMENATSRRAIMGYGLDAIRSLDEGNVGDAMRSGNSALESTPFDTGLKFEASEGKLYMVGSDGKKGEPLSANHLRAFVEDNMKTPETYLEWKKQVETERKNLEGEKVARKTAESGRISAEAQAETASFAGQRADAGTATALAAVISSLSRRDAAAHARAEELGWDASESIRVIQLANDFFMNEWRPLTPEVGDWFSDNPEAEGKFKSDVSQLMLEQGPGRGNRNTLDPDKAAIISQLIRQPGGIDLSATHPDFRVQRNKESGEMIAVYDGQTFRIPQGMYTDAMKNFKLVGGDAAPADPAATTSGTGGTEPVPAWQQEALRMGEEDRLKQQTEAISTQQQEDRYRQATHS
jgi:hypothetical protein